MAEPLCAECSRPIAPADDTSTLEQVDACTLAVERVSYHAACWDRKLGRERSDRPAGGRGTGAVN